MVGLVQNKQSPGTMTEHRAECFYAIKEDVDKVAAKPPAPTEGAEAQATQTTDGSKTITSQEGGPSSKKAEVKKEEKKDELRKKD